MARKPIDHGFNSLKMSADDTQKEVFTLIYSPSCVKPLPVIHTCLSICSNLSPSIFRGPPFTGHVEIKQAVILIGGIALLMGFEVLLFVLKAVQWQWGLMQWLDVPAQNKRDSIGDWANWRCQRASFEDFIKNGFKFAIYFTELPPSFQAAQSRWITTKDFLNLIVLGLLIIWLLNRRGPSSQWMLPVRSSIQRLLPSLAAILFWRILAFPCLNLALLWQWNG